MVDPSRVGSDEVHLWLVCVVDPPAAPVALESLLTPQERRQALRYALPEDRVRFVIGRGALRCLLGAYLSLEPDRVPIVSEPSGKPCLATTAAADDLRFNIAHSGDWVVIAATRQRAVGVDVERLRPVRDMDALAARFFAAGEAGAIRLFAEPHRREAFFACWTRKEAFVKAMGAGISFGLRRFEVTVDPNQPPALLSVDGSLRAAAAWRMWSLVPAPGYVAAVAVNDPDARLLVWDWTAGAGARRKSGAIPPRPPKGGADE